MIHKVYTIKILESRTRTLEARVEYLEQELNSADQITREQNSSVKITRTDTPVVEISRLERLEQRFEIMEEILAQPDGNQVRYYDGRILPPSPPLHRPLETWMSWIQMHREHYS